MPRKPIVRSNQHYYHVVARANNKDFYELPLQIVWNIMTGKLAKLQREFGLQISAFVLMNNHFHLLVLTPKEDIDRVMYFFMKDSTKAMQKHAGRINKIFGGRYKGCLIDNQGYLLNAYKYIYRNPVRAGIVTQAEMYPFSSLSPENHESLPFTLTEIVPLSLRSRSGLLEHRWINESFSPREDESMKFALSRTKFCYKKNHDSNREIVPQNSLKF